MTMTKGSKGRRAIARLAVFIREVYSRVRQLSGT